MAFSMMEAMGDYMAEKNKEIVKIHIDKLHNDPNNDFRVIGDEEIAKKNALLMDSIEQFGLLDPIIVRPHETAEGHYTVVSGHRRLFAHEMLAKDGKKEFENVSCIIITPDKTDAQQILIEANIANRDISDYEKMQAVKRMNEIFDRREEAGEKIKGRRRQHIAEALGMSVSAVGRLEKIEKSLSEEYKQELKEGNIGVSVADKLASKPEEEQKALHAAKGAKVKLVDLDDDKPEEKKEAPKPIITRTKLQGIEKGEINIVIQQYPGGYFTGFSGYAVDENGEIDEFCHENNFGRIYDTYEEAWDGAIAMIKRNPKAGPLFEAKEKQETPPPITQPEDEEDYCTTDSDIERDMADRAKDGVDYGAPYRIAAEALQESIDNLKGKQEQAHNDGTATIYVNIGVAIGYISDFLAQTKKLEKTGGLYD